MRRREKSFTKFVITTTTPRERDKQITLSKNQYSCIPRLLKPSKVAQNLFRISGIKKETMMIEWTSMKRILRCLGLSKK